MCLVKRLKPFIKRVKPALEALKDKTNETRLMILFQPPSVARYAHLFKRYETIKCKISDGENINYRTFHSQLRIMSCHAASSQQHLKPHYETQQV